MYLSRIHLALNSRDTMLALVRSNRFHEALDCCFSGGRTRNLWRIDSLNNGLYLLILSHEKPDFSSFCKKFAESESAWESKDYSVLLNRLKNGDIWRFRLTANPTRSVPFQKDKKRGDVQAHITPEHQRQWLLKRAEKHGFYLSEDDFNVIENKWRRFYKKDRKTVTLLSATYEGILKITDVNLFSEVLVNGLGRGKAYGMGLLTIVRA